MAKRICQGVALRPHGKGCVKRCAVEPLRLSLGAEWHANGHLTPTMKKGKEIREEEEMKKRIITIGGDHEYTFGGVRYIVSGKYIELGYMFRDGENRLPIRLEKHLKSSFAELNTAVDSDIIFGKYVCPTAGKED